LGALIGTSVAARLISHAGSLTNLAKAPASTVQILGAEKALFRALKTKGNTPKYGLIFHSSFIGRAAAKNKGRISRYLANKCAIAARLDSFMETTTTKFGERLRDQVEDRLKFYETGEAPKRNADVMKAVLDELAAEGSAAMATADAAYAEAKKSKKDKKDKKDKKAKAAAAAGDDEEMPAAGGAGAAADDDDADAAPPALMAAVGSKRSRHSAGLAATPAPVDEEDDGAALDAGLYAPPSGKRGRSGSLGGAGSASGGASGGGSGGDAGASGKKAKSEKKAKRARVEAGDDE